MHCEAPTLINENNPFNAPDAELARRLPLNSYTEALRELSLLLARRSMVFNARESVLDALRLSLPLDRKTDVGLNVHVRNEALRFGGTCWCRSRRTLVELDSLWPPLIGGRLPADPVACVRALHLADVQPRGSSDIDAGLKLRARVGTFERMVLAPGSRSRALRFDSTGAWLTILRAHAPFEKGADGQTARATEPGFALVFRVFPRAQSRPSKARGCESSAACRASSRLGASRDANRERFHFRNALKRTAARADTPPPGERHEPAHV